MRILTAAILLSLVLICLMPSSGQPVKETYMVSMRDSVRLATDIYRPDDSLARPVLLYRTPYWRFIDHPDGNYWNGKGCVVAAQDVRGRFASEGVDSVFLDDGWGPKQDGYDTVEWIVAQGWCNGKVGVLGASARGITAYRAVGSLHPNLECCAAAVACSDFFHQVVFPGGEFGKSLCEDWLRAQGSEYMIPFFLERPYYEEIWDQMNLHTRTDSIAIPILHIGGWYDCFSDGIVAAFSDLSLKPQAGPQKLVMGPWVHTTVGTNSAVGELVYPDAAFDADGYADMWLSHWLLGDTNGIENEAAVHYYLMGDPGGSGGAGCQWIEAPCWPPENAVGTAYFLAEGGVLTLTAPVENESLSYLFDPRDPVPTLGGNNLTIANGPYDQRAIGQRTDVLEFATDVLVSPLRVEGTVYADLFVSSDRRDTDFTLKLMDVYPDGREMLVTDGILRARYRFGDRLNEIAFMEPGQVTPVTIRIPPTAIVFDGGHRVKVAISSSNYPRFEVNPNTDDPPYQQTDTLVAANTLYFGGSRPSAVILPVVPDSVFVLETDTREEAGLFLSAFPNLFVSRAVLKYSLPGEMHVRLAVHDVSGRLIRTLSCGMQGRGGHVIVWDGSDEAGLSVPPGVYFSRLETSGGLSETSKLLLIR